VVKILIVDNEKDIVEFFARILSREGFEVLTATSAQEGLRLADLERPGLILLDINMPEMDGGDVQQALSENATTKNIPVVFLSGLITKEEEGDIKGRLYISKSSTKEEIIQKIKSVLGMKW
jgi:DNA-binding response OmpR family regulator